LFLSRFFCTFGNENPLTMKGLFYTLLLVANCTWAIGQQHNVGEVTVPYHIFSIYFGGGSHYIDQEQIDALNKWLDEIPELDSHDVSSEMITIQDFGQFNPLFDNSTWEGRRKNRRVDVIVWPPIQ
jgi:hypothetical protein